MFAELLNTPPRDNSHQIGLRVQVRRLAMKLSAATVQILVSLTLSVCSPSLMAQRPAPRTGPWTKCNAPGPAPRKRRDATPAPTHTAATPATAAAGTVVLPSTATGGGETSTAIPGSGSAAIGLARERDERRIDQGRANDGRSVGERMGIKRTTTEAKQGSQQLAKRRRAGTRRRDNQQTSGSRPFANRSASSPGGRRGRIRGAKTSSRWPRTSQPFRC